MVKVASLIGQLEAVLSAAERAGASVVSRPALGLSWITLQRGGDLAARVDALRRMLPDASLTVLDGAAAVADPRPVPPAAAQRVMERVKARFDPAGVFRPGAFMGGL